MTSAEREMVLHLIYSGAPDCCSKCIHNEKPTCCIYIAPDDYDGKLDDDVCIAGMLQYFENREALEV